MASITLAIDNELKLQMANFIWVNWSELVRERLANRKKEAELLLKRFHSKEEQELIKWSVELGRKAKIGRFKQLLKEISPEIREKLLLKLSPEKKLESE
ncbi:MAG: hypothetical protein NT076_04615 [Candidatus Pacearchaeota archaeon]|nr:hypothetical protein [Candidatus Pacearchaeota archaeon]